MGIIHIMERGGSEERRFKQALKQAKNAIEEICELSDEMEEQYGYSERSGGSSYRMGQRGYSQRDEMDEDMDRRMMERRRRDSMGRYM